MVEVESESPQILLFNLIIILISILMENGKISRHIGLAHVVGQILTEVNITLVFLMTILELRLSAC